MWVWFHRWFNDILIIYMKKVWKTIVTENQRRSSKAPVTLHRIKLYQLPFKKENQTIIPSAKMYTKIANPSLDQQFSKNNVLKIYFRKGNNWKKLENELRSCLKRSHSEKKTEIVVIKSNRRDPAITKSYDSKKHASEAHQKSWQQKKNVLQLESEACLVQSAYFSSHPKDTLTNGEVFGEVWFTKGHDDHFIWEARILHGWPLKKLVVFQ